MKKINEERKLRTCQSYPCERYGRVVLRARDLYQSTNFHTRVASSSSRFDTSTCSPHSHAFSLLFSLAPTPLRLHEGFLLNRRRNPQNPSSPRYLPLLALQSPQLWPFSELGELLAGSPWKPCSSSCWGISIFWFLVERKRRSFSVASWLWAAGGGEGRGHAVKRRGSRGKRRHGWRRALALDRLCGVCGAFLGSLFSLVFGSLGG